MCRRGYKLSVTGEQHAAAKRASTAGDRAVLGIKQPFVGAKFPVEPKRMVEARKHQLGVEHKAAMGNQRRIQEREVRGIGEHALIQALVIREFARRPDPDVFVNEQIYRGLAGLISIGRSRSQ